MREIVQDTGKRPYTGDDFLMLQDEMKAIWEGLFAPFGDFIISGLDIIDNGDGTYNVSEGLVMLDGKIRHFDEAQNVTLPIYIIPVEETINKQYFDGGVKPAIKNYKATYQTDMPSGIDYITINETGNRTWRDAIQGGLYQWLTNDQKTNLLSHLSDINNPHQVTPSQIGAATQTALDNHVNNMNNPHQVTLAQLQAAKDDLSNVSDSTILTKLKNVDGVGSGLDADTLQGNQPSAFATADHNHDTRYSHQYFYKNLSSTAGNWYQILKVSSYGGARGLYKIIFNLYTNNMHTHEIWFKKFYNENSFLILLNIFSMPIFSEIRVRLAADGFIYIDFLLNISNNTIEILTDKFTARYSNLYGIYPIENPDISNDTIYGTWEVPNYFVIGGKRVATVDDNTQTGVIYASDFQLQ